MKAEDKASQSVDI
jgi:hypothetical protein